MILSRAFAYEKSRTPREIPKGLPRGLARLDYLEENGLDLLACGDYDQ